jgi:hypothetical protein
VGGVATGNGLQLRAEADGEPGTGVEIECEGEVEGDALLRSRLNSATFLCCSS